jgi:hypothetical protein
MLNIVSYDYDTAKSALYTVKNVSRCCTLWHGIAA